MKEKKYREMSLLQERGVPNMGLYTRMGDMISIGYERVVFGKRGPYVEFDKYKIEEKRCIYRQTNYID